MPAPIPCDSRAIIPDVFSQFQSTADKNLFYWQDDPNFLCQGVYDVVYSPPLAIFLQLQHRGTNYGYWGIAFSQGFDATPYSDICFRVYTEAVSQVFWFQMRDLQETVGAVDVVIYQPGQWEEQCKSLTLFSAQNILLDRIDNLTLLFDERSLSSAIWVDDFEFR